MLVSSDGHMFIVGVFVGDGAECLDLQSLWQDGDMAAREAARVRADPDLCGSLGMYGSHAVVEVRQLEVYQSPPPPGKDTV